MSTITIGNLVYTYGGSTASVTGFVGGITTATIPSTIVVSSNTYNVTSIGDNAFRDCATLTSITIPNSVTTFGTFAFRNCTSLTSVSIPNSVTTFGTNIFNGCTALASVMLPTNLLEIPIGCFTGCASLSAISIPNSVTSIQRFAFGGCTSLSSISIPNSVTTITSYSFNGCNSLSSIYIPNSVTTIEDYAFRSCSILSYISIPNFVTSIGIEAFFSCNGLSSISIPNSVTSIGNNAFQYAPLNKVYFLQTSTLPTIGTNAFANIGTGSVGKYYSTVSNASSIEPLFTSISPISTSPPTLTAITAFTGTPNILLAISYANLVTNGNEVVVNTPYVFLVDSITSGSLSIGGTQGTAQPWSSSNKTIDASNNAYWSPPSYVASLVNAFSVVIQDSAGSLSSPSVQVPVNLKQSFMCFLEGTKILCFENNEEVYRPVENLRKGDLVKTIYNGYMPVCMLGTSHIYNPGNDYRITNRLYKCPKDKYPTLFEDLYITGCHSILVPWMTNDQWENTKAVNGNIYVTDNHFRLIACADEKAEPFNKEGFMNIYHVALEHHDVCMNYGIYANGLLVESCSIEYLIQYSSMKILGVNDSALCEDIGNVSNNMRCQLVDTC